MDLWQLADPPHKVWRIAQLPHTNAPSAFDQLHDGAMARGLGQGAVVGEKRCVKSFRQGDVSSVICRDVAA